MRFLINKKCFTYKWFGIFWVSYWKFFVLWKSKRFFLETILRNIVQKWSLVYLYSWGKLNLYLEAVLFMALLVFHGRFLVFSGLSAHFWGNYFKIYIGFFLLSFFFWLDKASFCLLVVAISRIATAIQLFFPCFGDAFNPNPNIFK